MKRFSLFLFFFPFFAFATTPSVVNVVTQAVGSASTVSFSVGVPAGLSNTASIVFWASGSGGTQPIVCTHDSGGTNQSMTSVSYNDINTVYARYQSYCILANPTTGTTTLKVDFAGTAGSSGLTFMALKDVNQASMVATTSTHLGGTGVTSVTTYATTTFDNVLLIKQIDEATDLTLTDGAGETNRSSFTWGTNKRQHISTKPLDLAGGFFMQTSGFTAGDTWDQMVIGIRGADSGGGGEPSSGSATATSTVQQNYEELLAMSWILGLFLSVVYLVYKIINK